MRRHLGGDSNMIRISQFGYYSTTAVVLAVVVAIIGIARFTFTHPSYTNFRKKGEQLQAIDHGKEIYMAMMAFKLEYGSFPDVQTAKAVIEKTKTELDLNGDTANDYFRQLIASGAVKSENPFFVATPYSKKNPDNDMTGNEALNAGEVGFGYIMNGNTAIVGDNPNQIIVAAPLLNANTNGEFDASCLNRRAVLVHVDGSVSLQHIREDNKVDIGEGKTLLETGQGTIWGTQVTPVLKPPKMKRR